MKICKKCFLLTSRNLSVRLLACNNFRTAERIFMWLVIWEYSKPSLIRLQLIRIEIWKMENSVHGWVNALKGTWHLGGRGLSDCVEGCWRDCETTQENIQDWLKLDEGDPGFQLLTEEDFPPVIFYCCFHQHAYIIKLTIYLFPTWFLSVF
jgi:hypothetical protein